MTSNIGSKSFPLPLESTNLNDNHKKFFSVLPYFGVINMIITSGTTIYRAYNNGDIQMIAFVTFMFFGTFLLDYWIRLYNKMPPHDQSYEKLKLKIRIWVLVSSIMFGFACEFSTFMGFYGSITFFGVVISGNTFLFYVYFIWEGDMSGKTCSITSAGKSKETLGSSYNGENGDENEYMALTKGVDNV
ncbi:hypothetical protein GLYMA_18G255500v4 [Glycine max]|uniref:Uncharacterized protein n=2 Tax=Glycine subgen. Soja TaxID=1462606 RepID=K7MUQ7_SOYBN|nr:uncharacterized protein LOC100779334 [Glycine max]XP_028213765.1 uncharacterized protein LOC114396074 [Glycine soja]KAG4925779.1 hypothetical protein JHK87_051319 [Glycine soja]KAH1156159.1 hypothetical protein GYH30_051104 [Glycine max]KAH1200004.1 hypothetical protein GmHk_18G053223 [Glycine max]KRH01125.1 hypothetical protein GLYMA_18G255500v4 [Glycine max]RZB53698.1 hypothetical protein D0Y65_049579 [Glycine soja]|eukprot:XP_014626238.1 uncharacterized protein LOC100779334 [Glycine max]